MDIKNVIAELASNPEGSFLDMVSLNGHSVGACTIAGESPVWEMHPDTEEFFYVIAGSVEITLLRGDAPEHVVAPAGTAFVVPQGIWHKPAAPDGASFMYLTPGTTLHSEADDPRIDSDTKHGA